MKRLIIKSKNRMWPTVIWQGTQLVLYYIGEDESDVEVRETRGIDFEESLPAPRPRRLHFCYHEADEWAPRTRRPLEGEGDFGASPRLCVIHGVEKYMENQQINACPKCLGTRIIRDNEVGEEVCSQCGLVISNVVVDAGAEWRAYELTRGAVQSRPNTDAILI